MADKPSLIHVEIFGQTYGVRAGADPGYVEALASFVDGQMKEVSRGSGAVDTVRIAVLAALSLADELFRLRHDLEDVQRELDQIRSRVKGGESSEERVKRLATTLGAALGE
jgi:cell division protein ZapA